MMEKQFIERLVELRMKKGVSARDMSTTIGFNAGYINDIESGKSMPTMTSFFNICQYLQITPEQFFQYQNSCPKEVEDICQNLKKLNDEQLYVVRFLIRGWLE